MERKQGDQITKIEMREIRPHPQPKEEVKFESMNERFQEWKQTHFVHSLQESKDILLKEINEEIASKVRPKQEIKEEVRGKLTEIIGEENLNTLEEFFCDADGAEQEIVLSLGEISKMVRIEFHQIVQNSLRGVSSTTLPGNQMKVFRQNKKQKTASQMTKKQRYDSLPQYLEVVVQFACRVNKDEAGKLVFDGVSSTNQVIEYMARRLRKDDRMDITALTHFEFDSIDPCLLKGTPLVLEVSQLLYVKRANAELIIRQQRCKDWSTDIKIGTFSRKLESQKPTYL